MASSSAAASGGWSGKSGEWCVAGAAGVVTGAAVEPESFRSASLIKLLKPISLRKATTSATGGTDRRPRSQGMSHGTSRCRRTSSRLARAASACSCRFCERFLPETWAAFARTSSSVPYCWRSCEAILGPISGTPGTLSTASPTRERKSTTWSGRIPHSASNSSLP